MRRLECGAGYGARAQASQACVREAEETPTGPTTWLCLWWLDEERKKDGEIHLDARRPKGFGIPHPEERSSDRKAEMVRRKAMRFLNVAFAKLHSRSEILQFAPFGAPCPSSF